MRKTKKWPMGELILIPFALPELQGYLIFVFPWPLDDAELVLSPCLLINSF